MFENHSKKPEIFFSNLGLFSIGNGDFIHFVQSNRYPIVLACNHKQLFIWPKNHDNEMIITTLICYVPPEYCAWMKTWRWNRLVCSSTLSTTRRPANAAEESLISFLSSLVIFLWKQKDFSARICSQEKVIHKTIFKNKCC